MAVDMYLKIDGVEGESVSKGFENQIDILSFQWGLSQSGTFHTGPGGGAGRAGVWRSVQRACTYRDSHRCKHRVHGPVDKIRGARGSGRRCPVSLLFDRCAFNHRPGHPTRLSRN